jgi:PleD family two-component response regulator
MGKARLLIVEDDVDISNMLRLYFSSQGYEIETSYRGEDAIKKARQVLPQLIILDIMLPDMDGYEVCKALRSITRISHIPILFLTQKDERRDKLKGLELGADDYITKPFDIEELKFRIQNAINRSERDSLTDAITGLPSGRLIEDQIRRVITQSGWAYLDIRINQLDPFKQAYGFIAANDALRFMGILIGEVVDELGTDHDFIGHAGGDDFIVITTEQAAPAIRELIKKRFNEEIQPHYNFLDRQQGFIQSHDESGKENQSPLMSVSIGQISPTSHTFSDIREITELAAEERRRDAGPTGI